MELNRDVLNHGLRLAFAAWLSFAIAVLLHFPNPYWAAMPIWVVAQSSRGLMLERGFFRILGTLVGAFVGFGILQFIHDPYLQILILGLWVALGSSMAHILRGVHSYGAILMAITASIVVLPSILAPDYSWSLVIARVQCTLIGVLIVTLVTGYFTPESPRQNFYRRIRRLSADAVNFTRLSIQDLSASELEIREQQILRQMSDVDANARMVSAGSLAAYRRLDYVDTLISNSLAVMAAGKAIQNLQRRQHTDLVKLLQELMELENWLRSEKRPTASPSFKQNQTVPVHPAVERLTQSIRQLILTETSLFDSPKSADAKSFRIKMQILAPHRDWILARRSGITSGLATVIAASAGLASGWPYAELAALSVSIFSVVLSSMPLPQKIAPYMLSGALLGLCFGLGYRLLIQPQFNSSLALLISVAPFLVLGGWARANKHTAPAAIDANMCFLVGSQVGSAGSSSVSQALGAAIAMALGVSIMTIGYMIWPRRPEKQALEIRNAIKRDLIGLTSPRVLSSIRWHALSGRNILNLMYHVGRVGELSGEIGKTVPHGLLSALNLGHAIVDLQNTLADQSLPLELKAQGLEALQTLDRALQSTMTPVDLKPLQTLKIAKAEITQALQDALDALPECAQLLTIPMHRKL